MIPSIEHRYSFAIDKRIKGKRDEADHVGKKHNDIQLQISKEKLEEWRREQGQVNTKK